MILNKRTIDFHQLLRKIPAIRLIKEQYIYHTCSDKFAGKNCGICGLPLNPYGIYLNYEQAICTQCFSDYISAENYLHNYKSFEAKVLLKNELLAAFSSSLNKNSRNIDLDLANQLFTGLSLAEIEQMIGLPANLGSFDHGIEAGNWKLINFRIEIWFKNQICTEVVLC